MPPIAASKKPAPEPASTATKVPEKKDAGKTTSARNEIKKRSETRRKTYSSHI
jgi:histone H2B